MGIKTMQDINLALISKMGWLMTSSRHRPWVNCLQAIYLTNSEFMQLERKASSSRIWKGLLKSRSIISQGRCFLVGNGESIRTWLDPWISSLPNFKPQPRSGSQSLHSESLVSHFIASSSRSWNVPFNSSTVAKILQIHLPPSNTLDNMVWTPDS